MDNTITMDIINIPNKQNAIKEFIDSEDSENVRQMLTLLCNGLSIEDVYMSIYKYSCIVRPKSETHTNLLACVTSLAHSEVLAHAMTVNCELIDKNISNLHEFEYLMMTNKYNDNRKYMDMLVDKFVQSDIHTKEDPYELMSYLTKLYTLSKENIYANIINAYSDREFTSIFYLFVMNMHKRTIKYTLSDNDYKNISIIEKYNEAYSKYVTKFHFPVNKLLTIENIIPVKMISDKINSVQKLFTLVSYAYKLEKYGVCESIFIFNSIAANRLLKSTMSASKVDLFPAIENLSNIMGKLLYEDFCVCDNNKYYVCTKNIRIEEYYKRYTKFNSFIEDPYEVLSSYLGTQMATRLCCLLNKNRIMYSEIFDIEEMMKNKTRISAMILCKHENVVNVIDIFVQAMDYNCSIVNHSITFNNILHISFYTAKEIEFLNKTQYVWMKCYYDGEQVKVYPSYITYLLTGVSFESTPSNIPAHINHNKAYVIPKYFRDVKYSQESYFDFR